MVSLISSHRSSAKSSSFFATAKILSGLLFLALALHGSSLPVNKRQTREEGGADSTDPTVAVRKQLAQSMSELTRVNTHDVLVNLSISQEDATGIRPIMNDLNTTVLCNMYDFYRDYTAILSTIQPYDPRHANYSYAQFVALKAMQSACQWIRRFASRDCTLTSIARTCFAVRYHRNVDQTSQVSENITVHVDRLNGAECLDVALLSSS